MIKKVISILFIVFPSCAFAFLENYNNYQYLIGDRAAGFGGAYCAIANDSTALWYNPAGLANIKDEKLNISANTYSYLTRNSKHYWQIEESAGQYETMDLKEQDISVIPTSVAYARKVQFLGNDTLAFGIFVPMQDSLEASISGKTYGALNVDLQATYRINSKAYYTLIGYGIEVIPSLNIGISAGLGYFLGKGGANIAAYLDPDPSGTNQNEIVMIINNELTAYTFFSGIGTQFALTPHHHVGVFFHTPIYRLYATRTESQTTQQVGPIFPDGNKSETTTIDDDYKKIIMPAYVSFGYCYVKENVFAWSVEGVVHFTSDDLPNKVVNGRTGIEVYILDSLIVRAGFFTDFCQKNKVTQTSTNDEKNDFYGATISLSFGNELNPLRDEAIKAKNMWTSIGVVYQLGIGHIRGFRFYTVSPQGDMPIEKQYTHRYSVYIGESIAF